MKNKTGIYTLRTAVILLLMITLALTAFLFINFAVTFLFFNRTEKLPFSWVTVTIFALVVGLLTAAAVWTFREPEEEDAPAPGEALETPV